MHYDSASTSSANGEWPSDMRISVDYPSNILTLLFIHQSWQLETETQLPNLTLTPHPGKSIAPTSASLVEWGRRWDQAWIQAWRWYGIERHRELFDTITSETFRAIVEKGYSLNPLVSPQWTFDYGDDGLDREAFYAWSAPLREEQKMELQAQPERVNLPALRSAWEGGLEAIIVLPFDVNWGRRLDVRHLAVSTRTRNDPRSYAAALAQS